MDSHRGTVGEQCSRQVVTVHRDTSIADCASLMHDRHVGTVVVVEENLLKKRPVGILTDRDIAIEVVAFGVDATLVRAEDLMRQTVVTVGRDAAVSQAVALMLEHGVRRLPVVDGEGALSGIISADDVWLLLTEQAKALAGVIRKGETRERRTRRARSRRARATEAS